MADDTYNGWSNYATWRIQLEIISDYVDSLEAEAFEDVSASDLAEGFKEYVDDVISGFGELDQQKGQDFALSYARAFVSDVNWYELAEHALVEDRS